MSRKFQHITPTDKMSGCVFIPVSGSAGETHTLNFADGSITYYGKKLTQSFSYVMIDNIGSGSVRVTLDLSGLDLTSSIAGAKTLLPRDTLHIEELVEIIEIYFIEASTVEIAALLETQGT